MPTYLDLVYYGNYVGRLKSGTELFQFFGNVYMVRPMAEMSVLMPNRLLQYLFQ